MEYIELLKCFKNNGKNQLNGGKKGQTLEDDRDSDDHQGDGRWPQITIIQMLTRGDHSSGDNRR